MRYRGWSLIVLFACGTGYAFYGRAQQKPAPPTSAPKTTATTAPLVTHRSSLVSTSSLTTRNTSLATATPANEPDVAATVNGVKILTADLNERANLLYEQIRPKRNYQFAPGEEQSRWLQARWQLLSDLIDDELRNQACKNAESNGKVKVKADLLQASIANGSRRFPTEQAFRTSQPYTLLKRDEWIRRMQVWDDWSRQLSQGVRVMPDEVESFHAMNPARWKAKDGKVLSFRQAELLVQQDLLADKRSQLVQDWLRSRRKGSKLEVALAPHLGLERQSDQEERHRRRVHRIPL